MEDEDGFVVIHIVLAPDFQFGRPQS